MIHVNAKTSIHRIPLDLLVLNDCTLWNFQKLEELYKELQKWPEGDLDPIQVKAATPGVRYAVIDGRHRTTAYRMARRNDILAVVVHG